MNFKKKKAFIPLQIEGYEPLKVHFTTSQATIEQILPCQKSFPSSVALWVKTETGYSLQSPGPIELFDEDDSRVFVYRNNNEVEGYLIITL